MKRDVRLDNIKVSEVGAPIPARERAEFYLRWLSGGENGLKAYALSVCERALALDRAKAAGISDRTL